MKASFTPAAVWAYLRSTQQQLVEVSLHALSTGMNEPFTAVTCIDRLGQGLARLVSRRMPSAVRSDDDGAVRVVAPRQTFAALLDGAVDPIRSHAAASPEVGMRLLVLLARVAQLAGRDEDRAAIRRQAELVRATMAPWRSDGTYGPRSKICASPHSALACRTRAPSAADDSRCRSSSPWGLPALTRSTAASRKGERARQ